MLKVRRADERGRTNSDWLDSRHTFSFGEYHDPAQMGHRTLRVINDDRVKPGAGFGRACASRQHGPRIGDPSRHHSTTETTHFLAGENLGD